MTDTNSPRPLLGMTTGEAEAWRAGWRAARDAIADFLDEENDKMLPYEPGTVDGDEIRLMEPPA